MGKYTEDDLKKSQKAPRDEFGVKILNIFYDVDSGMKILFVGCPSTDMRWSNIIFKVRDEM